MSVNHDAGGSGAPMRKARRSWFDNPPTPELALPHNGMETKPPRTKRRSLDSVETLTLTHFTSPPKISFGKILVGKSKLRTLLIRNPHDYDQEVVVERFPFKKNFKIEHSRFVVGAEDVFELEITWSPEEDGGCREMIQFSVNGIFRLQAFVLGTVEKPKAPRKVRRYPMGPRVKQPGTVVQTSALTHIKSSYSPRRSQEARDLMAELGSRGQRGENKENSEILKSQESKYLTVAKENCNNPEPAGPTVFAETRADPCAAEVFAPRPSHEGEEASKSPSPLESTAIFAKPDEASKHRRQWRKISDITSPVLNTMSPIPLNEGNENGITVDSYFQANEASAEKAREKHKGQAEAGEKKDNAALNAAAVSRNEYLKETFVVPLLPAGKVADTTSSIRNDQSRREDGKTFCTEDITHKSTSQQSKTRVLTPKKGKDVAHLMRSNSVDLPLSDAKKVNPASGGTKSRTSADPKELEMMKRIAWNSPNTSENQNSTKTSPASPNTMLNESLSLISQMKVGCVRSSGGVISPPEGNSMNSSIISQGMGMVSPNSFMEDMKAMAHDQSGSGTRNEPPSPSATLNNSIPHRAVVSHLQNVRVSLTYSPKTAPSGSSSGTPKKRPSEKFGTKRRSISSQFRKEEVQMTTGVVKKNQRRLSGQKEEWKRKGPCAQRGSASTAQEVKRNKSVGKVGCQQVKVKTQSTTSARESSAKRQESDIKKKNLKKKSPTVAKREVAEKLTTNKVVKLQGSPFESNVTERKKKKGTPSSKPEVQEDKLVCPSVEKHNGETDEQVTPVKEGSAVDSGTIVKGRSFDVSHERSGSFFENLLPDDDGVDKNESNGGKNSSLSRRGNLFPDLNLADTVTVSQNEISLAEDFCREIACSTEATLDAGSLKTSEQGTMRADVAGTITMAAEQSSSYVITPRKSQLDRVVNAAERSLSPQRFCPVSPSALPTSPGMASEFSRRGTMTVTKSRPSDALLAALNNRKRQMLLSSRQDSPGTLPGDDTETTENIRIHVEEHYEEIDGQMYVVVKETTDVVKSMTETYIEAVPASPQQFNTPPQLPTSPNPDLSRRSTHIIRSPKVIDVAAMNKRKLKFCTSVETSATSDGMAGVCPEMGKTLSVPVIPQPGGIMPERMETPTVSSSTLVTEASGNEQNTVEMLSDELGKSNDLQKTEEVQQHQFEMVKTSMTEASAPPITSVCLMSNKIVDYEDISEEDSVGNVTKDSLDSSRISTFSSDSLQVQRKEYVASSLHQEITVVPLSESPLESQAVRQFACPEKISDETNSVQTSSSAVAQKETSETQDPCVDHREMFITERRVCFVPTVLAQRRPKKVTEKKMLRRSISADGLMPRNTAFDIPVADEEREETHSDPVHATVPPDSLDNAKSDTACSNPKRALFVKPTTRAKKPLLSRSSQGQLPTSKMPGGQASTLKVRSRSLSSLTGPSDEKVQKAAVADSSINRKPVRPSKTVKPAPSGSVKKKGPKGVAQSRLILLKKAKSGTPRHPMPFAARNMYYDERWMEKQERGFVQWLNFVLTPPDEYLAVTSKPKVDARALSLDTRNVAPRLAPTKEILSFRAYAARRRLNRLRRAACELYQSQKVVEIIRRVEVEVESRRITVRKEKMVHADLGIKQKMLDLLLQYSSLWLRVGLETVFGEILMLQSNQDVVGLSRFIVTRLLSCPDIAAEYSHPTVPHLYRDGFAAAVSRHMVKKFLLMVYFMDTAKTDRLIDHDPCLFCKDAEIKSSKEILVQFSREVLSGEGDITRHLAYMGYTVSQVQQPIDEFDYAVACLSKDLKDGLRLGRVLELLAGDSSVMGKLRAPAISRLQKVHNMEAFFKAMAKRGLEFNTLEGVAVTARDVVDGHREKTLALLWHLIIHFQNSVQVNEEHLREEISLLEKSLRLTVALQSVGAILARGCEARRDSGDSNLPQDNEMMRLVFQWCRLVALHYGVKVENFTVSFSDGRALCCLLHHYHPALLPLEEINFRTTVSFQEEAEQRCEAGADPDTSADWGTGGGLLQGEDDPEMFDQLLANEKANFKTLYEKVSALGGVPLMLKSGDMSNTIPDEKVVSTYVSYLCARLLDIRQEVRAARVLQMAWRRKRLRRALRERKIRIEAAVKIQQWIRPLLAQRFAHQRALAAVRLQCAWRRFRACKMLAHLRQEKLAKAELERKASAATTIQRTWRASMIRRREAKVKEMEKKRVIYEMQQKAATTVQRHVRGLQCRREFVRSKQAAVCVQSAWRRHQAKKSLEMLKKERVNKSAVVIQKFMRGRLCRKGFLTSKQAAVTIQKQWRMKLAQKFLVCLRTQKKTMAATVIQKHVRGRLCRREIEGLRGSALILQKLWRAKKAREVVESLRAERQKEAAVLVQSVVRCASDRRKFLRLKRAAVCVQTQWRCVLAQREFMRLRLERQTHAAVVIQKNFHRFKAKKELYALRCAAVVIQKLWRARQARLELRKLRGQQKDRAALILQKHARGFLCRKNLQRSQMAAQKIQGLWRVCLARRELLRLRDQRRKSATIIIQKMFRGLQQRQAFAKIKGSVITLQSAWRVVRARRLFRKLREEKENKSALCIQSNWRMFQARHSFIRQRQAAVLMQCYWRGFLTRRQLEKSQEAAMVIQCWYRACVAARHQRLEFIEKKHLAELVQKMWRGYLARRNYQRERQAAIVIQAHFRCFRRRLKFLALRLASVIIQRGYRNYRLGKQTRQEYIAITQAACTLQRWYRKCLELRHAQQISSAIKIQAAFRAYKTRQMVTTKRNAALVIQMKFRAHLQMREERRKFLEQKQAAVTIQSCFRGYREQVMYKNILTSAIRIQALERKRQDRKRFLALKQAAVILQRRYRAKMLGLVFREAFLSIRSSVIIIQRFYRAVKVGEQLKELLDTQRAAAIKIQSTYRGWSLRQDYLMLRAACVCCQRRYRAVQLGRSVRQEMKHRCVATRVIQREWRRYLCVREAKRELEERREEVRRESQRQQEAERLAEEQRLMQEKAEDERKVFEMQRCQAARVIQKQFVLYRQKLCSERREKAAVMVQKCFRAYLVRCKYQETRNKLLFLQRLIRGFAVRRDFERQRLVAVLIQRWWRATLLAKHCRQEFESSRDAAVRIQTMYRMIRQRREYALSLQRVTKIQACVRMHVEHKRFIHVKCATIAIQRSLRSYLAMRRDRQQFLAAKHSAIKIQCEIRKWLACRRHKQEASVVALQSHWRMCQQRKEFQDAREAAMTLRALWESSQDNKQQQEHAARSIQLLFRNYMNKKLCLEHTAACIIQRAFRTFHQGRLQVKADAASIIQKAFRKHLAHKRQVQHKSAEAIQLAFRQHLIQRQAIKNESAVVIQSQVRRYLACRRFQAILGSVVTLQASVRGWLARQRAEELRKEQRALVFLQAQVRGYLVRKKVLPVLQARLDAIQEERKQRKASTKIQALWRGYKVRRNSRSRRLIQARKRISELSQEATEEKTLGSRMSSALDYLLRDKDVAYILEAMMHLEVSTRLSPVCCERMIEVDAVPALYRLAASCNRSIPHMEIIKHTVDTLLNLAKYDKTVAVVMEPEESISTIMELMLIYREKGPIFYKCCMLLGILGLDPRRRQVILNQAHLIERLQSIHSLTLRKLKVSRTHKATQAKMAAMKSFNCTMPVATPTKRRRIRPQWVLAKDTMHEFDDPLTSISFVMDVLHIGPKL
ncbi:abnormal spindle-like microcephaly-associated protein homolog [Aplysia californica]|uniref:Abnormal spindle-like microcephaly-associated protein homolog n=1 Tax=Aplysia californica TaxID=6500 RepID=A0ABM0JJK9_APLCA|nr:abnormal spindle-like microcephaly-associated protein homolog [Aplysia californica]